MIYNENINKLIQIELLNFSNSPRNVMSGANITINKPRLRFNVIVYK